MTQPSEESPYFFARTNFRNRGNPGLLGCNLVDALQINGSIFEDGHNMVFVDDEGLLTEPPAAHFFELDTEFGRTQPIPGRGQR